MVIFGSSPLARGTCLHHFAAANKRRLIPARAGNISRFASTPTRRAAHPRSRGEHSVRASKTARVSGSSPLARGTSGRTHYRLHWRRLIPARAGNILRWNFRLRVSTAHPRSRGEHWLRCRRRARLSGSSPLARGTCRWGGGMRPRTRLIPARAGNICAADWSISAAAAHPRSRGEHFSMTNKE